MGWNYGILPFCGRRSGILLSGVGFSDLGAISFSGVDGSMPDAGMLRCCVCVRGGGRFHGFVSDISVFFPGLCGVVFVDEAPRTMFKAEAIRG